jgi:HK97 family phage portal protein
MKMTNRFPFLQSETKILRSRIDDLEKRSLENPASWDWDWVFGGETSSGIVVNEQSSLKFAAVWAAVKLISESCAQLPYQVFRRTETGKEIFRDHPSYKLIHERPNQYMNKFTFIQTLMSWVLLWGNGYARIVKDMFERPIELIILPANTVEPILIENRLFYRINGTEVIPSRDMFHVMGFSLDGIKGMAPIQMAKENIGLGMAAQKFGATFFKNGANSEMSFETPAVMTDDQYRRLQKVIMDRNSGGENAHKPLILEGGSAVKTLTIPPDQAQFLQTRNFQVGEIARIFNLPPHMIGDLERSTNNNIEQQAIEYVQYSLMPWINRIEEEATNKLIFEVEKPMVFIEGNVDGLMRGDAQARAAYYKTRWEVGSLSANEIRAKENDNPYEGGDEKYVPVNYQTVAKSQSISEPNPGADPGSGGGTGNNNTV